jgi:hypothetical protein
MEERALLNDAANFITWIGQAGGCEVKEISVNGRDAASRVLAHRTGLLKSAVNGVIGKANGE